MKEVLNMDLRRGALLMLTGMAIIGLIDNFVVRIAEYAGLWQFHFLRAVLALPMLVGIGLVLGSRLLPQRVWAVVLRSFFLAASMLIYFGSIPLMPISIVVACLFTSPVFVLLFSVVVFGQRIGVFRVFAVLLGFAGVLLILNPGGDFSAAMLLPVLAGALYALNAITARRFCADEDTIAMLIAFFSMLGLFGLIGLSVFDAGMEARFPERGWVAPSKELWFWLLIQAAGSIVAVGLLTRAYQGAETTYLVTFEYSLLIFASFWAWVLYGDAVSVQAAIGMGLIIASGVIIAIRSGPG